MTTPPLGQRILPLVIFGYVVGAIRLGFDAVDPDSAMWFGLYYTMPLAILYVGVKRKWGIVDWKTMAGTMVVVGFVVWGFWTTLSYTLGQFLEWTEGRYYPGERMLDEAGEVYYEGARASPPADAPMGKIGAGLLHGLLSSLAGSVWCILFGTFFVWVYRPPAKKQ